MFKKVEQFLAKIQSSKSKVDRLLIGAWRGMNRDTSLES
jgi:hypothetical protein